MIPPDDGREYDIETDSYWYPDEKRPDPMQHVTATQAAMNELAARRQQMVQMSGVAQGLGGLGAGLSGGGAIMSQQPITGLQMSSAANCSDTIALPDVDPGFYRGRPIKKPETIREELQEETNQWLKGVL